MTTASHVRRGLGVLLVVGLVVGAVACVQNAPDPGTPIGPSELALSLTVTATPDILPLDGASQSLIRILARDVGGESVSDLTLLLQLSASGTLSDFGQLSSRQIVTGRDGRAAATYTVPLQATSDGGAPDTGQVVTIWVTPVGDNFANAIARSLTIRLVPSGTVIPPFDVSAGFSFTPEAPTAFETVLFTATCQNGATTDCVHDPLGVVSTYAWAFGDGSTAVGPTVSHAYDGPGTYLATLTASDQYGRSTSVTRSVVVGGGTPPTAVITVSPATPNVSDLVFFNAGASTAAPGRTISSYEWDFGDGRTATGATASHQYGFEGTYVVSLTVRDDQGQVGTATASVQVTLAGPTAVFVFSPTEPVAGAPVFFDATASEGGPGRDVVAYRWNFGDGGISTTGPRTNHRYTAAGIYTVQLTVFNDVGEQHTISQTVTVDP